jgi:hypothetical protein
MKTSPKYAFIQRTAFGVAIAMGAVMLTPSVGYARVAGPQEAQGCSEQIVMRHVGPPGKGFDQAVRRNQCDEVEFAAFEATQTENRNCPATGRSPTVGLPAGKGFDYLSRIAKC